MKFNTISELIGNTPVISLQNIAPPDSTLSVKWEGYNPARSIKDRAALRMIIEGENTGMLQPGGTIIESTSGNLGKSLAMLGVSRGYNVVLVIDPKTPLSSRRFFNALGSSTIEVNKPDSSGSYQTQRIALVKHMLSEHPDWFWPNQYNNEANPRAHFETTAPEIFKEGTPDAICMSVSTGGHLKGISDFVNKYQFPTTVIAVDAVGSAALGQEYRGYKMRGMGLSWAAPNASEAEFDYIHSVDDAIGIATMRSVAVNEGLLIGESSGATVFAGLAFACTHPGSTVVAVAADDGANYLAESFDRSWGHTIGIDIPSFDEPSKLQEAARVAGNRLYGKD